MDWIPAFATTGLFIAALWLARNLIATRLAKSIQHEFDVKLEGIRSEFRLLEDAIW